MISSIISILIRFIYLLLAIFTHDLRAGCFENGTIFAASILGRGVKIVFLRKSKRVFVIGPLIRTYLVIANR